MITSLVATINDFAVAGSIARPSSPAERSDIEIRAVGPFERLIQITRSNDRLLIELAAAKRKLRQARDYQFDPDSHVALGNALVAHARKGQVRVLARLRENRLEALRLLASGSVGR